MKIILACKTLSQLFSLGIKHFRDCLFTKSSQVPAISGSPEKPASRQASQGAELGKQKFDQLLSYIYVSRKGITWQELRELIPNLNDEDIEIFQQIFGFLLVSYMPENNISASASQSVLPQSFIFFKHPSFKKAVRHTIESLINDQTRAQLHKNLATLIEKQEPANQFLW